MAVMKMSLDWLADKVMQYLETQDFDEAYLEDKRAELAGKSRWEVLIWCGRLDAENAERFSDFIGIPMEDLLTTIRTLSRL